MNETATTCFSSHIGSIDQTPEPGALSARSILDHLGGWSFLRCIGADHLVQTQWDLRFELQPCCEEVFNKIQILQTGPGLFAVRLYWSRGNGIDLRFINGMESVRTDDLRGTVLALCGLPLSLWA